MVLKQRRAWLILSGEQGQDDFVEAITFGLGKEGLIKFQEMGEKNKKRKIFQEAENVLNEITEA